jgi:hypothetical protein
MNLETAARSQPNQYAELKRIVKHRGLPRNRRSIAP